MKKHILTGLIAIFSFSIVPDIVAEAVPRDLIPKVWDASGKHQTSTQAPIYFEKTPAGKATGFLAGAVKFFFPWTGKSVPVGNPKTEKKQEVLGEVKLVDTKYYPKKKGWFGKEEETKGVTYVKDPFGTNSVKGAKVTARPMQPIPTPQKAQIISTRNYPGKSPLVGPPRQEQQREAQLAEKKQAEVAQQQQKANLAKQAHQAQQQQQAKQAQLARLQQPANRGNLALQQRPQAAQSKLALQRTDVTVRNKAVGSSNLRVPGNSLQPTDVTVGNKTAPLSDLQRRAIKACREDMPRLAEQQRRTGLINDVQYRERVAAWKKTANAVEAGHASHNWAMYAQTPEMEARSMRQQLQGLHDMPPWVREKMRAQQQRTKGMTFQQANEMSAREGRQLLQQQQQQSYQQPQYDNSAEASYYARFGLSLEGGRANQLTHAAWLQGQR